MTPRLLIVIGALLAGLGVAAGAFGAHGLTDIVTAQRLGVYETAVRYHIYHALALVVTGGLALSATGGAHLAVAGYLFLAGIVLFSGSLYLLVLTDTPWLGAVTPIGGVAFIAGWAALAMGAWRNFS